MVYTALEEFVIKQTKRISGSTDLFVEPLRQGCRLSLYMPSVSGYEDGVFSLHIYRDKPKLSNWWNPRSYTCSADGLEERAIKELLASTAVICAEQAYFTDQDGTPTNLDTVSLVMHEGTRIYSLQASRGARQHQIYSALVSQGGAFLPSGERPIDTVYRDFLIVAKEI